MPGVRSIIGRFLLRPRKSCLIIICFGTFLSILKWLATDLHPHLGRGDLGNMGQVLEPAKKQRKPQQHVINPHNDSDFILPHSEDAMRDDLTVVSAFFDLGRFQKGEGDAFFTPNLYRRWMRSFSSLNNSVIMFVDSAQDAQYFTQLRSELPSNMTIVRVISRHDLWAFKLLPRIKSIFDRPGYPKYHPNTVMPEYSCAMHAKYELMRLTILENPFRTKYFCWLDTGLFRSLIERPEEKLYSLWLPPEFDQNRVAYTEVERFVHDRILDMKTIMTGNVVWLCGCFFISRAAVMIRWVQDYMKATERYLDLRYMNTDQQVLYSMIKDKTNKILVQPYVPDGRYDLWFHLGYVCKDSGEQRFKKKTKNTTIQP